MSEKKRGISVLKDGINIEGNQAVTFVRDGKIVSLYFDDIFELMEGDDDKPKMEMNYKIVNK